MRRELENSRKITINVRKYMKKRMQKVRGLAVSE